MASLAYADAMRDLKFNSCLETISENSELCLSTDCSDVSGESPKSFDAPEALLFFDWDDTLLPTSWISRQGWLNEDGGLDSVDEVSLTREQQVLLQELEVKVEQTLLTAWNLTASGQSIARWLRATLSSAVFCELHCFPVCAQAMAYGRVVIVTNALEGWVETSCAAFLPGLRPLLDELDIVSARSTYESLGDASPTAWKRRAFADVIVAASDEMEDSRPNIVCVGDSMYEHVALSAAVRGMPSCRMKSLKLLEHPCIRQLIEDRGQRAPILVMFMYIALCFEFSSEPWPDWAEHLKLQPAEQALPLMGTLSTHVTSLSAMVHVSWARLMDEVHTSNATCIRDTEGSFEERRQRLDQRLRKSQEVSRADLVQRNIVPGVSVVRRGIHVLEGLLRSRPSLEQLTAANRLPPNYIDKMFPDDASGSAAPKAERKPAVSLNQLLSPPSNRPEAPGPPPGAAVSPGPAGPGPGPPNYMPVPGGQVPVDPAVLATWMVQAAMMKSPSPITGLPPYPGTMPPFAGAMPAAGFPPGAAFPRPGFQPRVQAAPGSEASEPPNNIGVDMIAPIRPPKPSIQAQRAASPHVPAVSRTEVPPFVALLENFCNHMLGSDPVSPPGR
eukprot:s815_g5.t2